MKNTPLIAIFSIAMFAQSAQAASAFDTKLSLGSRDADDSRCKKDVGQYLDALRFVHQSAGGEVSARVMNSFVDLGQLNRTISAQGYCAAAGLLREKRALQ